MLKIGIIGMGRIGKVHAQSIAYYVPNAQVAAVADPYLTDDAKALAAQFGATQFYTDYKQLLADPAIDAVLICSSTDTHSTISVEAIEAGKHVFCEKPIDHDLGRIACVVEALKHSPVKYQVGFNRRFDHNFAAVRAAVKDGRIGDAHIVKITSRDPAPPSAEYAAVSGGMFLDMTIHDFDMVRFLSGDEVEEVYVQPAVLVDPAIGAAGDVDTAIITMKLSSGALAVIDNSRKAAYGYDQRAEVFGSKGMAATANDSESTIVVSDCDGVTGEKPLYFFLERYMQSFANEVKQFVDAVVNDTDTPVGVNDGLQAVLIGLAAKKSAAEHRPVALTEIG